MWGIPADVCCDFPLKLNASHRHACIFFLFLYYIASRAIVLMQTVLSSSCFRSIFSQPTDTDSLQRQDSRVVLGVILTSCHCECGCVNADNGIVPIASINLIVMIKSI